MNLNNNWKENGKKIEIVFDFVYLNKYSIESPFDVSEKYFMVKFFNGNPNKYKGKIIYPTACSEV